VSVLKKKQQEEGWEPQDCVFQLQIVWGIRNLYKNLKLQKIELTCRKNCLTKVELFLIILIVPSSFLE
jgi:hypothetical protein